MPGKLLIVDSIATNRIVLTVRLENAFYDVSQAESSADALAYLKTATPDLILINGQLQDQDAIHFCEALRRQKKTAYLPILIICNDNGRDERLRALKAGANDVLVRPIQEDVMLARLRSLLRTHETAEESQLREHTNKALGFAETPAGFTPRYNILLATYDSGTSKRWAALLKPALPYAFVPKVHGEALRDMPSAPAPDLFIIAIDDRNPEPGLRLIAETRARAATRNAGVLVIMDRQDRRTLVDSMDMGAHDVMVHGFDVDETVSRISTLVKQKKFADNLRADLKSGLQAAVTDELTGLFNRRYATMHTKKLVEQAHRKGRQIAVMLADLDHFKSVNDQYGHAVGDTVLVGATRRIRENLRGVDLVARMGGEEFLIVLPETSVERAEDTAARLCTLLRETPIALEDHVSKVPITMSIGIAMAGRGLPDMSVDELLDQADKALYEAKARGRDQVCISGLLPDLVDT